MPGGQVGTKTLPFGGSIGFYRQLMAFEHRIPGRNTRSIVSSMLLVGGVLQHIIWARHLVSYRSVNSKEDAVVPGSAQAQQLYKVN